MWNNAATGCAIFSGGIGIAKNLYIGASGGLTVSAPTVSTSPTTGCGVFAGGMGVGGNITSFGDVNTSGNATVSGTLTSAIIISTISGQLNISNTTDATSTSTGAMVVSGGVGIPKIYMWGVKSIARIQPMRHQHPQGQSLHQEV